MYNDYYLEQLNNKLAQTNNNLVNIESNQEDIIEQLEVLESGDRDIINELHNLQTITALTSIAIVMAIIYHFVERCLR